MELLDQKKKITIMVAIMAAMLFAALNQTIVGTALPRIISDLGGLEYFSWVFTIYMLTSSVTAILVGKLSDIYGRKPFLIIGLLIFILGSFLTGLSTTIAHLIIFRGIQGFGGGMIMSTAFTAIGDLFSPRERGKWQGMMSGVFGLASVFGPTLGGWIVDHLHWHWVFWVFLPLGLIVLPLIYFLFPTTKQQEKESIDYYGSLFITATMVPLLLAFSWAGTKYEWNSVEILGLLTVSIIAFIIFVRIENKVASPLLPLFLFKNKIFTLSNLVGFTLGAGMFGAIMYMPFFVQGVIGTSAAVSGLVLMPMTLSMVFASAISGQLISKTGKYKILALIGLLIMSTGLFSLSLMDKDTTNITAIINMIIVGLGLGISFPIFTLTIQNSVEHRYLGVATASSQLFRQLGGTVGVSIMGAIMSFRMNDKLQSSFASMPREVEHLSERIENIQSPQLLINPEQLQKVQESLPEALLSTFNNLLLVLTEALSYSLTGVFFAGGIVIFTAFVMTIFLDEIPLRTFNKNRKNNEITENH
ncbi:MFS transporter [Lottiidibacillus patelloidae]|uniref:MFS transporter n=2 Tax=Lottiidibacillus patelloidae TaxID=2670334 RepID=A0A263BVB2_9BACI|nr:MFS transporter [Lottiidibacillus patelloidae]